MNTENSTQKGRTEIELRPREEWEELLRKLGNPKFNRMSRTSTSPALDEWNALNPDVALPTENYTEWKKDDPASLLP